MKIKITLLAMAVIPAGTFSSCSLRIGGGAGGRHERRRSYVQQVNNDIKNVSMNPAGIQPVAIV